MCRWWVDELKLALNLAHAHTSLQPSLKQLRARHAEATPAWRRGGGQRTGTAEHLDLPDAIVQGVGAQCKEQANGHVQAVNTGPGGHLWPLVVLFPSFGLRAMAVPAQKTRAEGEALQEEPKRTREGGFCRASDTCSHPPSLHLNIQPVLLVLWVFKVKDARADHVGPECSHKAANCRPHCLIHRRLPVHNSLQSRVQVLVGVELHAYNSTWPG
eukprot:scaffold7143_cov17-Tisochrysis_lutea.AAC.2